MKVGGAVITALSNAIVEERCVVLVGHLEPSIYRLVDKALKAMGGKWNTRAKSHLFEYDPRPLIEQAVLTGEVSDKKKDLGQFYTSLLLADMVVNRAGILFGQSVLEPSAGDGALALTALAVTANVDVVEIDDTAVEKLLKHSFRTITKGDFLAIDPPPIRYDHVIMNPPFAKRMDVVHVMHAAKFLKPGGRLTAIISGGTPSRQDKLTHEFRNMLQLNEGWIEDLPEGSFKLAGTSVRTCLIGMKRCNGSMP